MAANRCWLVVGLRRSVVGGGLTLVSSAASRRSTAPYSPEYLEKNSANFACEVFYEVALHNPGPTPLDVPVLIRREWHIYARGKLRCL